MDILNSIELQASNYKRGLLTYSEMLDNIIRIADSERPRFIEFRKGKTGAWRRFSDKLYNLDEINGLLESLNYNSMGYQFRAAIAK